MHRSHKSLFFLPSLCLFAALGIFSTALFLPSLPSIQAALKTSQNHVLFTVAIFFLGSTIGNLLLGPLSDQMGRLSIAKAGLIIFILTSFWCAEAQTLFEFLLARFFQGIGASVGILIARAVGRDLYEGPDFTRFSATIMMVISISPAIAPSLGGLIEASFGWKMNFYFLMFFGVTVSFFVWFLLPETLKSPTKASNVLVTLKNYFLLFKVSTYGLFCLVICLQMIAIFCYITLSPYLYMDLFKWSPQAYGLVGITSAFGNIIGFAFSRHLSHRLSFHKGILIGSTLCFFLSLIFVGIFYLFQANAAQLICYTVCFFAFSALPVVNAAAAAMNLFPDKAGLSSAMIGAIQIGGGALGGALASVLPVSSLALGITLGILSFLSLIAGIFIANKEWLGR